MDTDDENGIKWAIDMLSPDPLHQEHLLSKYYHYWVLPSLFVSGQVGANWALNRPILSSFHRYPILFGFGIVAAYYTKKYKLYREGFRDSVLRQYIRQHPEDFQHEPKLYKDVFNSWVPLR